MLYLLFSVTVIFFIIAGVVRTGRKFNPLTFYISFWGIWLIISLSDPFLLKSVSVQAYLLLWLNIVGFAIGFILFYSNSNKQKNNYGRIKITETKILSGYKELLNNKKFIFLQLGILLILIYYYLKYNMLLSTLTTQDTRRIVYEYGLLFSSMYEYILFTWIITPLVYSSIALLISNLVVNGQKNFVLYISLVNCLLFGMIGSGRFVYFQVIVFAFVSIGFNSDRKLLNLVKIKLKTKILVLLVFLAAVYAMNISTLKRYGINSFNLNKTIDVFINISLKQFFVYFLGPFRAFDNFLATYSGVNTLGRSTFGGIEEILNLPFTFVGLGWTTANEISSYFTVESINIGSDISFNAYYTNVMNFYMDGGISFVITLSLIFGATSALTYNYYLKNSNIFTFSLIVLLTYHMIASEFRWSFSSPVTWIEVALLLWANQCYVKISKKNEVKYRNT